MENIELEARLPFAQIRLLKLGTAELHRLLDSLTREQLHEQLTDLQADLLRQTLSNADRLTRFLNASGLDNPDSSYPIDNIHRKLLSQKIFLCTEKVESMIAVLNQLSC